MRKNLLLQLAAALAASPNPAEAQAASHHVSAQRAPRAYTLSSSLPVSQPRHCPAGYGRPERGWRAVQSRARHAEGMRRQRRNAG